MHLRKNFMTRRMTVLFVLGLALMWGLNLSTAAAAEDPHAGHGPAKGEGHAEHAEEEHGEHDDHAAEKGDPDKDAHEGHDHGEEDEHEASHDKPAAAGDGHEDHDDGDHDEDGHEGHDHGEDAHEEEGLRLTADQLKRFGIVVQAAGPGSLNNEVRLPGEIVFNQDTLVHLVPRASGIAVKIHKTLVDPVKVGETLALIDSAELAAAKLDYFSAVSEVGCCQFDLPRAQAVHDNVVKLLESLKSSPSVEQLREVAQGEMGDYRSQLIVSFAEFVRTQKAYKREGILMAKKISSEGDFLAAESEFRAAQATYYGTRDSVAFKVRQTLLESTRDRQLAEFRAQTAKQKLLMLGLSEAEVTKLAALPTEKVDKAEAHVCTDPNCTSCETDQKGATEVKHAESRVNHANLGWYEIKAPSEGIIVEKHITLGERVGEDTDIFTIADTRSVWVDLTVYTKDLAAIRKGQAVVLRADHSGVQARGEIAMVTPFVKESTRTATARVVMDNRDGRWLPGTFVTGFIQTSEKNLPVVVPRDAVQNIEGRDVVFVEHEGAFEMTPVNLGHTDRTQAEIISGLEPGARYVAKGAFQLKATIITSTLDSHAGHGH